MIKKQLFFIFIIFSFFVSQQNINLVYAQSDGIEVNLTVKEIPRGGGSITGSYRLPLLKDTTPMKDTTAPQNPKYLRAVANPDGILLSWLNPPDEDFSYVRLMRNEGHFYGDPFLGTLIYEGTKQFFFDKNVVANTKYFYTLFSRDTTGNFSSGSAISIVAFSFIRISPPITFPDIKISTIINSPKYTVHQYGQAVKLLSNTIPTLVNDNTNIIIDTDTAPFTNNYLIVTGPNGENLGQYMFSFNKDSGRYESVIPPLHNMGLHNITIIGYKNNQLEILGKGLLYVAKDSIQIQKIEQSGNSILGLLDQDTIQYLGYAFLILFSLLMLKITR